MESVFYEWCSTVQASVPETSDKLGEWLIDYAIVLYELAHQWKLAQR